MEYKTLESFIDKVEDNRYRKGDPFKLGEKTTEARIKSLLSDDNNQGRPMIEEVKKEIKKEGE